MVVFVFCSFSSSQPLSPLPLLLIPLSFLLCSCSLVQGYQFTSAGARRAFRRVPSRGELFLTVVCSRPVVRRCQALLLSHEGATGHELEPYFQHVVRPLVPLVLYGRFARRDPPCHKQECVYYFWRDRCCFEVSSKHIRVSVCVSLAVHGVRVDAMLESLSPRHGVRCTYAAPHDWTPRWRAFRPNW